MREWGIYRPCSAAVLTLGATQMLNHDGDSSTTVTAVIRAISKGSGILGKSAIALGILLVAVVVGEFRLATDNGRLIVIAMGAVIFFLWFVPILLFAHKNPAEALLDGVHWTEHQKFMHISASKELPSGPSDSNSKIQT